MRMRAYLTVAIVLATARAASAQVTCGDPQKMPNPVYILAADTQVASIKALGAKLRALPTPISLVWTPSGSCTNLANMYKASFTPVNGQLISYIPTPADDPNFDPKTSTPPTCTLPATPIAPDLAMSIVFPDAANCPTAGTKPSGLGIYRGPVQAFLFAVPRMSSQVAITAEEAYLVLGLGALNASVPPWDDPNLIYGRPPTKGTQIGIGANILVPAAKWQLLNDTTHRIDQSTVMASTLASHNTDGNAEKTLGILGTEIYDTTANRAALKSLAFRAFKQLHAFWPDSTPSSFDKRNVRDGHYLLWSYVQYVAADNGGTPSDARVKLIVDSYLGNDISAQASFEPLDIVIGNGLVPICAMKVQRSVEGGDLSLYSSPAPCGCYFEKNVPAGSTSCTACSPANTCATGVCRHGYCEAK